MYTTLPLMSCTHVGVIAHAHTHTKAHYTERDARQKLEVFGVAHGSNAEKTPIHVDSSMPCYTV